MPVTPPTLLRFSNLALLSNSSSNKNPPDKSGGFLLLLERQIQIFSPYLVQIGIPIILDAEPAVSHDHISGVPVDGEPRLVVGLISQRDQHRRGPEAQLHRQIASVSGIGAFDRVAARGNGPVNFGEVRVEIRPQEAVLRFPLVELIMLGIICHEYSPFRDMRVPNARRTAGRGGLLLPDALRAGVGTRPYVQAPQDSPPGTEPRK